MFMRLAEVARYLGVTKRHIYELQKQNADFPRKIALSSRCVGWKKEEIDAWLDTRKVESKGPG
jgi:predicted DNA-binding transcriptional regulator AlpA